MTYEIILRKQPEKYLKKLDEKAKRLFKSVFEKLEQAPLQIARKLRGELEGLHKVQVGNKNHPPSAENLFSGNVGNKRMVIFINESKKRIEVLEIGPGGDIYNFRRKPRV